MAQNLGERTCPYMSVEMSEFSMEEHITPNRRELLSRQIRFVRHVSERHKQLLVHVITPVFGFVIFLK